MIYIINYPIGRNLKEFKTINLAYLAITIVAIIMGATPCVAQRKTCIDAGWHFRYGDGSTAIHNHAATAAWRALDLPTE